MAPNASEINKYCPFCLDTLWVLKNIDWTPNIYSWLAYPLEFKRRYQQKQHASFYQYSCLSPPQFCPSASICYQCHSCLLPSFISLRTVEMARKSHKMLMKMKTLFLKKDKFFVNSWLWVSDLRCWWRTRNNLRRKDQSWPILTFFFKNLQYFSLGLVLLLWVLLIGRWMGKRA